MLCIKFDVFGNRLMNNWVLIESFDKDNVVHMKCYIALRPSNSLNTINFIVTNDQK
jgi:hypothetical protein